jgi:PIN domain nuclease of toxin-antitoxin system
VILLDTCALLWLSHDHHKFSDQTLKRIEKEPIVYISAITGFEIGVKAKKGKLELPMSPAEWLEGLADYHALTVFDITLDISIKATQLPPIHNDPCDRIIIATALLHPMPVVTADNRFREYGVEVLL